MLLGKKLSQNRNIVEVYLCINQASGDVIYSKSPTLMNRTVPHSVYGYSTTAGVTRLNPGTAALSNKDRVYTDRYKLKLDRSNHTAYVEQTFQNGTIAVFNSEASMGSVYSFGSGVLNSTPQNYETLIDLETNTVRVESGRSWGTNTTRTKTAYTPLGSYWSYVQTIKSLTPTQTWNNATLYYNGTSRLTISSGLYLGGMCTIGEDLIFAHPGFQNGQIYRVNQTQYVIFGGGLLGVNSIFYNTFDKCIAITGYEYGDSASNQKIRLMRYEPSVARIDLVNPYGSTNRTVKLLGVKQDRYYVLSAPTVAREDDNEAHLLVYNGEYNLISDILLDNISFDELVPLENVWGKATLISSKIQDGYAVLSYGNYIIRVKCE